ncbi:MULTISPECIES: pyrimidine 5'-nucleotidase [Methylobacterium]|uniref:pyrimidine 5'-nucleotidase n=1 Tax=Methylobacterium TaxID=407 RepID=UPI001053E599|nr:MULTISPECIES: pyrimidine 5'-nucleotidase [Methylobacterium]MDR7036888.1 putative hydrolase of the HAD superfamily [Methylobacterium sp. BE186]
MFSPASSHFTTSDARRFEGVDTWVFDLDNTLYPSDARVWPQVDERITLYVMRLYGLDGLSARALQKHFYHRYGTTLKALMIEDGVEPHDFLDFAHDIDHSSIKLDTALGDAIERLPGRKLILTNGSRRHAENVAGKLGILDHFEDVFDIAAADFVPKPERTTYERFLTRHGVDPRRSALFEDIARNLVVPHDLGMATVLVVPPVLDPFRERFEQEAVKEPHIDYITNDLAGFLADRVLPSDGTGRAA